MEDNFSEDAYLPESEWPTIAFQESVDHGSGAASEAIDESSAWPSILSENDSLDCASDFPVAEDFSASNKSKQEQVDVNQVEPPDDQNEDIFMPDLQLIAEVEGSEKQLTNDDDGIDANNYSPIDFDQELGELRFADEE